MSYFKKFCDLVGGIGAGFAAVFLLGRYMEYNPAEGESKLKVFFSTENAKEYRQYLIFIALLFAAVLLGRVLKRYPAATLAISVFPLCQVMGMLWGKRIYANAEFYVIVSLVVVVGNIYEAYFSDRESAGRRKQLNIASALVGGLGVVLSFVSLKLSSMASEMSEKFFEIELTEAEELLRERLSLIGVDLITEMPEGEAGALIFIAAALAVSLIFSFIARRFNLLNAILASVPFIYAVSALHAEKLVTAPMLVLVPTAVYFFCRTAFVGRKDV